MSKKMSVKKFIKKKNKIIFDLTRITLVPEEQIINVSKNELFEREADSSVCPYCLYFIDDNGVLDCKNCPMGKASNQCSYEGSTYTMVIDELQEMTDYSDIYEIPQIQKLAKKYNKQFKGKK